MTPNPWFRITIDRERLIDDMFAFVTDPTPARNRRPVLRALDDLHPESVEVMEAMLLDGTEERADVAAYVAAVFGGPDRDEDRPPRPPGGRREGRR